MQDRDRAKFSGLLTEVMAFYGKDVSDFALTTWWGACQPFDFEQVNKAMGAHVMDPECGQFAPKPADVVRALQGTRTDRSRQAWGQVLDAMHRVGAYQSVVFDDPIVHLVIEDLGGWMQTCRTVADSYQEHRFCEAYRAYAGRTNGLPPHPPKLVGEFEATNSQEGRRVRPPVLIGNHERAALVFKGGSPEGRNQITALTATLAQRLQIGVDV